MYECWCSATSRRVTLRHEISWRDLPKDDSRCQHRRNVKTIFDSSETLYLSLIFSGKWHLYEICELQSCVWMYYVQVFKIFSLNKLLNHVKSILFTSHHCQKTFKGASK
jgi:hypothetical protein